MRLPPSLDSASIRTVWTNTHAVVRRLNDVLGLGVVAAGIALVAVLGALVAQLPAVADSYDAVLAADPAHSQTAAALRAEASVRERWQLVLACLLLLIVVATVVLLLRRILQPMRTLTRDIDRVAHETLPAAVAALATNSAPDAEPIVEPLTTRGPGELTALATAATALHACATSLAAREHLRHQRRSELMIDLCRRNHGLLDRLVSQIVELDPTETDPGTSRPRLTAIRARRHVASMLVLTDMAPERRRTRPAPMADILRAALAGIQGHSRVRTRDVEPAAVGALVVDDLAHLVAELVENATHFSPPDTRVDVSAAMTGDARAYRIRITDHGIGMTADQLDDATDRIHGAGPDARPSKLIGLNVVGRLAARHGITVTLSSGASSPGGTGLTATVTVPDGLLAPMSAMPAPRRPISDLVAAAAFVPPRPGAPVYPAPPSRHETQQARDGQPEEPDFVRPGVPRRVPGAQLPDLGPVRDESPHVVPDATRVGRRLEGLQAGLDAARTNNIPPLPRPLASPGATPDPSPGAPDTAPRAASDSTAGDDD